MQSALRKMGARRSFGWTLGRRSADAKENRFTRTQRTRIFGQCALPNNRCRCFCESVKSMNTNLTSSILIHNRRHFLRGLSLGAALFTVPGAFAAELVRTPRQTEG